MDDPLKSLARPSRAEACGVYTKIAPSLSTATIAKLRLLVMAEQTAALSAHSARSGTLLGRRECAASSKGDRVTRSSLMLGLLLTVMGGVASAATVDQPASSLVSTLAAPADCKASLAKVGIPAFLQATSPFQVCGACSDSVCQGTTIG